MDKPASETKIQVQPLPIGKIYASPHQMRRHFDEAGLKDLARSLKQEGLIQPITVRPVGATFELIAGERRLKAAQILGWETIDARVLDISDEDAAIKGLIENLQRQDLTPIEEARGYKQLIDAPYNMTQEAIGQRVGKSQTAIARSLALLELPAEVQEIMPRGIISEAHTRHLRKLTNKTHQIELARQADKEGWTAKETERQVHAAIKSSGQSIKSRKPQKTTKGDPLAKLWGPWLEGAEEGKLGLRKVRYEGAARWALHVEAEGEAPHTRLGELLIQLGESLKEAGATGRVVRTGDFKAPGNVENKPDLAPAPVDPPRN